LVFMNITVAFIKTYNLLLKEANHMRSAMSSSSL
jgi:hypothetical protein